MQRSERSSFSTWCSSAKCENFNHIAQILLYHSLVSLHTQELRISFVLPTIIIECYEILNSRFALEHRYLTFGIETLSRTDENSVKLRPARFNRKSGWLQRMLHGDRQMYSSSNSIEDSAYVPLAENDQCVAPSSKEEKDGGDEDDFVKVPVPHIKSQDSTAFVLTKSKDDEPCTATVENLFDSHFRRIRNALLPTVEYNKSLRTINPGKETQGRSGAFLFKTRDQRLILKTVAKTELEVLRSLLEDPVRPSRSTSNDLTYTEYMETYGHESLIMKIVGCFRLTLHEYVRVRARSARNLIISL